MSGGLDQAAFRTRRSEQETRRTRRDAGLLVKRPAGVARRLGLAHEVEAKIRAGDFLNYAHAARHYKCTRARITQVMDLLFLAPDIQVQILSLTAEPGHEFVSERDVRMIAMKPCWGDQRVLWSVLREPSERVGWYGAPIPDASA